MYGEFTIGDRIRERREELGMTQSELAEYMGYKSRSSINKIENGTNDIPQSKVVRFAEALNTTVSHLMGWDEDGDLIASLNQDALEHFDGDVEKFLEFEQARAKDAMMESTYNPIQKIEQQIKEMAEDTTIPWDKPMPIYKGVNFIGNTYRFSECTGYTYVGNIDDFEHHICLEIPNNDFEPEFLQGDTALIHRQAELENEKYFYVVIGETPTIRKVTIKDSKTVILKADNPKAQLIFENKDNLKIIGKVVALKKTRDRKL